jgi:hypothetical protein
MRTRLVGAVDLQPDALAKDLATARDFSYSHAYSDYLCGGPWRSSMLWTTDGETRDGVITSYDHDGQPGFTPNGQQLPYLRDLIETNFDTERLNFVRLAAVSNSVIIPHRDLLELDEIPDDQRNTHRVHVPLATNEHCFFAEEDSVFSMRVGEVWILNAANIHSVAALSSEDRIHLILDFVGTGDPETLVRLPAGSARHEGIPAERIRTRPPLEAARRAALVALADVITPENLRDVFSIVVKESFLRDGGPGFVWQTFTEIAERTTNAEVAAQITEMHRYFLLERTDGRKTA